MKKNISGFTLLELLVVVVIIGILAAIALPQYQLAVDKATFAKLQTLGRSVRDAYNEHVLLHGTGTKNFNDLSVNLPSGFTSSYERTEYNCVSNHEMFCCMSKIGTQSSASINCGKNDLSIIYNESFIGMNNTEIDRRGKCKALENNTRANRLCSSIGTYNKISNSWTPQGYSNRYKTYLLK